MSISRRRLKHFKPARRTVLGIESLLDARSAPYMKKLNFSSLNLRLAS